MQSWRHIGSFGAFPATSYGRLLLAKLAVVGLVLALGAVSWRAVHRSHRPPGLRRSVPGEVIGAAVVLAVTAVLVSTPPPPQSVAAPASTSVQLAGGAAADLHLMPAAVGHNALHLTVRDASGRPLTVPEIVVRATLPERGLGPFPVPMRSHGPGRYVGHAAFPFAGDWQLELTVRTSELDASVATATVGVAATPSTHTGGHP